MNSYQESYGIITQILKNSGLNYEADMIDKLGSLADSNIEDINAIYSQSNTNSLFTVLVNITENNKINENKLQDIWTTNQKTLRNNYYIKVNFSKQKHITTLDSLGILDHFDGKITFFLHPQFTLKFFKYLINEEKVNLDKHVKTIKTINQKDDAPDMRVTNLKNDIDEGIKKYLVYKNKEDLNKALKNKTIMNSHIEFLPTSTDFYKAGIKFYNSKNSISLDLFNDLDEGFIDKLGSLFSVNNRKSFFKTPYSVFATSSGLLLPEEFYGSEYFKHKDFEGNYPALSEKYDKNEYRENYFERLKEASKNKPIFYYFDKTKAKKQFNKIYSQLYTKKDKEKYEKNAKDIWERYANNKNIEIIKVKHIKGIYEYFTLSNGRNVMITNRGKKGNKIGHGFWIKPDNNNLFDMAINFIKKNGLKIGPLGPAYFYDFKDVISYPIAGTILAMTPIMIILLMTAKENYDENIQIIDTFFHQAKSDLPEPEVVKYFGKDQPEVQVNHISDLFD
ncbi:MAG: hypothetical protein K9K32_04500 [Halanaerobiales bacterium]|nr:hypothetical protein [Halanaerobiales bacterium]